LISQRFDPYFKDAHLKWELPGETNKFGKRLEKILKREIIKEAGLNAEVLDILPCSF